MKIGVTIDLNALGLRELHALSGAQTRIALHQDMGEAVRETTRAHLAGLAQTRHTTAEALGATPSGFLGRAARAVESAPVSADAGAAEMTLNHPGMIRAFRDVTIVPRNAKMLTIPVNALAYNRTPAAFWDAWHLQVKGGAIVSKDAPDVKLWVLCRSVTQKQDRSLLPSDEEWSDSAATAAEHFYERRIAELTGGAA